MEKGYSGIVNISPFACLIGRVIEGLFTPWARERNYPALSVEVDGNLLPPNIVNKLNIFMVNVLRFRGKGDLSGLIDKAGKRSRRFAPVLAVSRDNPQDGGFACSSASCAVCASADCPAAGEKPDDEEEPFAAGK